MKKPDFKLKIQFNADPGSIDIKDAHSITPKGLSKFSKPNNTEESKKFEINP